MTNYETLKDAALFSLASEGNASAFQELHARYKGLLIVHAYKKLGDFERARDVVQDLFLTLWEKKTEVEIHHNVSGYLYRSLRNRIINLLLRDQLNERYLQHFRHVYQEGENQTDEHLREQELARQIEQEIQALPTRMQHVFRLSREQQLTHREIATHLNISENTVKNHLKAALKRLRAKLN